MALANLTICYTGRNIKSAYNKNKFKTSAPNWYDEFDLIFRHSRLFWVHY